MTDAGDRRFSEDQFALILRKAAELQERDPRSPVSRGMTFQDIEQIAAEAGIDPRYVRDAVSLLDARQPGLAAALLGGPVRQRYESTVDGSIPPEDLNKLLDVIRQVTGKPGEVKHVLNDLEWSSGSGATSVHVNVANRDGRTSVQVFGDRMELALVQYIVLGLAGVLTSVGVVGAMGTPLGLDLALVGAGVAATWGGIRALWKVTSRKGRRQLEELVGRLSDEARRLARPLGDERAPEESDGGAY